ncbi:nad(P)-binding protein [Alternaria alternata]|nr:nad(P)-binding protein [Alternaria alternata]
MTTLQPLLARLRAISTPIPGSVSRTRGQGVLHSVPLDAPVTMAVLPSNMRWPEPLARFVEAVRV